MKNLEGLLQQLNNETKEHSVRVAELCQKGAGQNRLDPDLAYRIGFLHDIGKIYIPPRILKKKTKLTAVERTVVDMHSYYGYKFLKDNRESKRVYLPILYHHKDKPIFPEHPKMPSEIQPYTELIRCMDMFDALTNERAYHSAISKEKAIQILRKNGIKEIWIRLL